MDQNTPPLPPELQCRIDEVERQAEAEESKNPRFNFSKAWIVSLFCFGLAFTLGIAMRQGMANSLFFGVFVAFTGFVTAGFQKPKK